LGKVENYQKTQENLMKEKKRQKRRKRHFGWTRSNR
jgi:ribosomal protein L44E